ncbi:MAG: DNA polymerase III subunit alpha [Candidatus Cloacimonetes bacterium]|nr:DNA polymerase III subunit alpha [Candidatus Cloacimonadota bacterium]
MGFIHLHNHTQYSALDGACRTDKIINLTKQYGMPAVAITDHGTMAGAIDFYETALQNGVKPIIGIEAYIINNDLDSPAAKNDRRHHLILLVQNSVGYQNLIKLSSRSYLEGFYYKPRISKNLLREYSEGLICLSACLKGEIPSLLLEKRTKEAEKVVDFYKEIFPDRFYIEIMDHGLEEEKIVIPDLCDLAKRTDTPLVVTNDCHYLQKEDAEAHDILLCIQTAKTQKDTNRLKYETDQLYFKTEEEMRGLFPNEPAAYENTIKIAEQIDFTLNYQSFLIPKCRLPQEYNDNTTYLRKLCFDNLPILYPQVTNEIKERLEYELQVINNLGYENYFLVVKDIVDAARANDIPVGPGRGSAAGSIVSYLLGITKIDPLPHNLFFERFLNPDRIEMPDIDIDFCAEGRNKIIDYVIRMYGRNSVSQIITFNTLAAKSVIKDVARVLEIPAAEANKITKLMPNIPKITLEKCLEDYSEFRELMDNNPLYSSIIKYGLVLEGLIRQHGIHAAGVVIGPDDLSNYVPLAISNQKVGPPAVLVQYEGKWLSFLKMMKMDILGLKTLTIIKRTLKLIKESQGIELDIDNVDLTDSKTYKLFSKGQTDGIFQFESAGMKKYLKDLKPNVFSDLVAMVALYRPGPMQYIDSYIRRKNGQEEVNYDHSLIEKVLKETYGVIVYQEQVMQISREMAGFTGGEADTLRKSMGKKNMEVMHQLKSKYFKGAQDKGVPEETIAKIWDKCIEFAKYAFNKSHSVCYAYVAFQTAFLKSHYPIEFMAAILSLENDPAKIPYFLEECKNMGIEVIPPNINLCLKDFTVQGDKILFGLRGIKNVGDVAIQKIIEEREENGNFQDLFEFCSRIDLTAVNRAVIESLIYAGALDELEGNRSEKTAGLDCAIEYGNSVSSERKRGQQTLFTILEDDDDDGSVPNGCKPMLPQRNEWTLTEKLEKEKLVLGFYFSGHPLFKYQTEIEYFTNMNTKKYSERRAVNTKERILIAGVVSEIIKRKDNRNKVPYVMVMEDQYGRFEVAIPNRSVAKFEPLMNEGRKYLIIGKTNDYRGVGNNFDTSILRIYPDKILCFDELAKYFKGEITMDIKQELLNHDMIGALEDIARESPGKFYINLNVKTSKYDYLQITPQKYSFFPGSKFNSRVKELFNDQAKVNVRINESF